MAACPPEPSPDAEAERLLSLSLHPLDTGACLDLSRSSVISYQAIVRKRRELKNLDLYLRDEPHSVVGPRGGAVIQEIHLTPKRLESKHILNLDVL